MPKYGKEYQLLPLGDMGVCWMSAAPSLTGLMSWFSGEDNAAEAKALPPLCGVGWKFSTRWDDEAKSCWRAIISGLSSMEAKCGLETWDELRCYNSDLENTTLHTQTPISHGLTSWSFLRTHMDHKSLRARFTKQNKLAWDSNPIKVQWERKKLQLINAQIKEYRCSWIISVIINIIYKKQCKLA